MKLIFAFLIVLICGCKDSNDPRVIKNNKLTLSQNGEEIGILPDGRKVFRYRIDMGDYHSDHWIYVVEKSITVNREESTTNGDGVTTTTNYTESFIEN